MERVRRGEGGGVFAQQSQVRFNRIFMCTQVKWREKSKGALLSEKEEKPTA